MGKLNRNLNLAIAAACLLILTFVYMYFSKIPFGKMPILVWVLFAFAIITPLVKGLKENKKKNS